MGMNGMLSLQNLVLTRGNADVGGGALAIYHGMVREEQPATRMYNTVLFSSSFCLTAAALGAAARSRRSCTTWCSRTTTPTRGAARYPPSTALSKCATALRCVRACVARLAPLFLQPPPRVL